MEREFLAGRISATKLQIVAYEDALLAFATDSAVQSYTLDTQQSRQTVTRADVASMQSVLTRLYNQLATLQARLTGAAVTVVPGW